MRFKNAYKGIKKIYFCEMIVIIISLLAFFSAIIKELKIENKVLDNVISILVMISSFVFIFVFILRFVGLKQASRDDYSIKIAFGFSIIGIILSVALSVLGMLSKTPIIIAISAIINLIIDIISSLVICFLLTGISSLANQLGDNKMERWGKRLVVVLMFLYAISIFLGIYGSMLISVIPNWAQFTLGIASILGALLELIIYISIVIYYQKAVKMLKK